MTINERIKEAIKNMDCEKDDLNKIIALAYYAGREAATKETSDKYSALIQEQKKRARDCRYSGMANRIVGEQNYIYCSDYAGEMTATFGSDETTI